MYRLPVSSRHSVEVVEKNDGSRKCRFRVVFYLQRNIHLGFGNAAQIGEGFQFYAQPYFAVYQHGLVKFQAFNAIVDQHLVITDVCNLFPQVRHYRQGEVTVGNGGFKQAGI